MTELSPAAQAALDAFRSSHTGQGCLAAALRTAADQVVPDDEFTPWRSHIILSEPAASIRSEILSIAAELDPP